jgi:hypothetical protein
VTDVDVLIEDALNAELVVEAADVPGPSAEADGADMPAEEIGADPGPNSATAASPADLLERRAKQRSAFLERVVDMWARCCHDGSMAFGEALSLADRCERGTSLALIRKRLAAHVEQSIAWIHWDGILPENIGRVTYRDRKTNTLNYQMPGPLTRKQFDEDLANGDVTILVADTGVKMVRPKDQRLEVPDHIRYVEEK